MRIGFTKMHGLGNDFAVFDAPPGAAPFPERELRRLADRHTGIGFDQALLVQAPRRAGTDAFYRIFNADGSEVEQCGNGARCVAALMVARGAGHGGTVTLDSPAGLVHAHVQSGGRVAVDMGQVRFDPAALPFDAPRQADRYRLELDGETLEIGAVSIGNPHAVLAVASTDAAPVERVGPAIESHPRFAQRVNVGFMQVLDRMHIRLRVYERGVGETLACGTGACAAVAVGCRWGLLDREVSVGAPGGELLVRWDGPEAPIWLTGPAEIAFVGEIDL